MKGVAARPRKYNRFEVTLRIKSPTGTLLAEQTIRGDRVELLTYFPSGRIEHHTEIELEQFITELEKLQDNPYLENG